MKARAVSLTVLSLPMFLLSLHHTPTPDTHAPAARPTVTANPWEDRLPSVSRSFARPPLPHPKPTHHALPAYEVWANSPTARSILAVETDHNPSSLAQNSGVYYFGRWQMNADFVQTYGRVDPWTYVTGGRFMMPIWMQDKIAYQGYLRRGWQPWHGDGAV